METGICAFTLIPCRAEPSEKSEMVNQLLFGEMYRINHEIENWFHITTVTDHYSGYIDKKLHTTFAEEKIETSIFPSALGMLTSTDGDTVFITAGSRIPVEKPFTLRNRDYSLMEYSEKKSLTETARMFLNVPYLWGGKSIFGIDCSGFCQVVFRIHGFELPRDAWQQEHIGELVTFGKQKTGDLAFFANNQSKVTHVGICLEGDKIIHASGRCRIDRLTGEGIFNEETGSYSHNLFSIRRII